MSVLHLNHAKYLELENLSTGVFYPLTGFMDEVDFNSVVNSMRLRDGTPFPIPIVFDISRKDFERIRGRSCVRLIFNNEEIGHLYPTSIYSPNKQKSAKEIFGTTDPLHPGVKSFLSMEELFLGGQVEVLKLRPPKFPDCEYTPMASKELFKRLEMKTVAGFQTRNVPHRAHEYLQRIALELVDGLFVQPIIGSKKDGDYSSEAVVRGYQKLIREFFPPNRVILGTLSTAMRYAGPREAVFHAIIRRNYGCTHFIVGRDHAGVSNYYGKYDAHKLIKSFKDELGIKIMRLHGPYYCSKCDGIVTERTCGHQQSDPRSITHISGTDIRAMLVGGQLPDKNLMRPEIIDSLRGVQLFIEEE